MRAFWWMMLWAQGICAQMLFPVRSGQGFDYKDAQGNVKCHVEAEKAGLFKNGYAVFWRMAGAGLIDSTGEVVLPAEYSKVEPLASGAFQAFNGREWLLFLGNDTLSFPTKMQVSFISDSVVRFSDSKTYGLLFTSSKRFTGLQSDYWPYEQYSGLIRYHTKDSQVLFLNARGDTLGEFKGYMAQWPSEAWMSLEKDSMVRLVDTIGLVWQDSLDYIGGVGDGLFYLNRGAKCAVWDSGSKTYSMDWRTGKLEWMQGDVLRLETENGYGLVRGGSLVLSPPYDAFYYLDSDRVLTRKDGAYGFCTLSTGAVVPAKFDDITIRMDGTMLVVKEGKYGLMGANLEQLVPCRYTRIEFFPDLYNAWDGTRLTQYHLRSGRVAEVLELGQAGEALATKMWKIEGVSMASIARRMDSSRVQRTQAQPRQFWFPTASRAIMKDSMVTGYRYAPIKEDSSLYCSPRFIDFAARKDSGMIYGLNNVKFKLGEALVNSIIMREFNPERSRAISPEVWAIGESSFHRRNAHMMPVWNEKQEVSFYHPDSGLLDKKFSSIRLMSGNAWLVSQGGEKVRVERSGVVSCDYSDLVATWDLLRVSNWKREQSFGLKGGKWGLLRTSGEYLLPPEYDAVKWLSSGYFLVENEGKKGLCSRDTLVIAPTYKSLQVVPRHDSSLILTYQAAGAVRLYAQGKEVLKGMGSSFGMSGGVTFAQKGYDWFSINRDGRVDTLEQMRGISRKGDYISVRWKGNQGLIDANGEVVLPIDYDKVTIVGPDLFLVGKVKSRQFLINSTGDTLYPKALYLVQEKDGLFWFKDVARSILVTDHQGNVLARNLPGTKGSFDPGHKVYWEPRGEVSLVYYANDRGDKWKQDAKAEHYFPGMKEVRTKDGLEWKTLEGETVADGAPGEFLEWISEDLVLLESGGRQGIWDLSESKFLLPCAYRSIERVREGVVECRGETGRRLCLVQGDTVFSEEYAFLHFHDHDGFLVGTKHVNADYRWLDGEFKDVFPCEFDHLEPWVDGMAVASLNGDYYLAHKSGLLTPLHLGGKPSIRSSGIISVQPMLMGLRDAHGRVILQDEWNEIELGSDVIRAYKDQQAYYFDYSGKELDRLREAPHSKVHPQGPSDVSRVP